MSQPKEIFVIQDRCMGCHSCELACTVAHSTAKSLYPAMKEIPLPKKRIYLELAEPDQNVPIVCRNCEKASCLHACISGAISRNAEGVLLIDDDKCIGCWTCVMMCAYGVIGRNEEQHTAYRCDRCYPQSIPACVLACPTKALQFKTVEKLAKNIRKEAAPKMVAEPLQPLE